MPRGLTKQEIDYIKLKSITDVATDKVRAAIRDYTNDLAGKGMTVRFIRNRLIDIIEELC